MILGFYFFVVVVLVGRKINASVMDVSDSKDKDTCCDSRLLVPTWLAKYLMFMILGEHQRKLAMMMVMWGMLYTFYVFLLSWLFGWILFRSTRTPWEMFGYGLLLYIVIELTIGLFFVAYWVSQATVDSWKRMRSFEFDFDKQMEEEGTENYNARDPDQKLDKMAQRLAFGQT